MITKDVCIDSKYLVVRRGKKKYYVGIYKQMSWTSIFYDII